MTASLSFSGARPQPEHQQQRAGHGYGGAGEALGVIGDGVRDGDWYCPADGCACDSHHPIDCSFYSALHPPTTLRICPAHTAFPSPAGRSTLLVGPSASAAVCPASAAVAVVRAATPCTRVQHPPYPRWTRPRACSRSRRMQCRAWWCAVPPVPPVPPTAVYVLPIFLLFCWRWRQHEARGVLFWVISSGDSSCALCML